MNNDLLDHALKYADRGIPVFPVQPDGKAPLGKLAPNGVNDATTDKQQIRDWWRPVPSANVGIATGEVFAIDLDVGDGKNGVESWKELTADKEVPETTAVMTPSGGVHLYFRTPEDVEIANSVSTLGDGVDVRGHGGYVIAPPSSRADGEYTFRTDTKGIASAPFWLLSEVKKARPEPTPEPEGSYEDDPDLEVVESALNAIPPQPNYHEWIRIIAAVRDAVGSDRKAAQMLESWSPERDGDYTYGEKLKNAPDDRITAGTLFYLAEQNGWTHPARRNDAKGAPAGDGQAGAAPKGPHPADGGDNHPDEYYEGTPTGYEDEEGEDDTPTLDDLQIESVPELLASDIRPPEPLVTYEGRSLLHEGTSQLAAKPKIGKTNLAMNLGLAIASEKGKALGNADVQRRGRVLMLNLDGSRRGSYGRFETMTGHDEQPPPDRFDILHGQFPEVGDGGLDLLREYLHEHGDTELVIVDTLQHLRPTSDGRRNVYHEDYDFVHPITELGRETDTSILLVHHLNKLENGDELDKVSGSTGLTGAVENVMILDRARGETKATLSIRPREDREEDFNLEFDGHLQTWIVGDQGYEPSSKARREIYNFLQDQGSAPLRAIADAVGKKTDNVSKRLAAMKDNGAPIKKPQRGIYKLVSGAS